MCESMHFRQGKNLSRLRIGSATIGISGSRIKGFWEVATKTKPPSRASIIARIKEYKRIGRDAFLRKYASGFPSRSWFIVYDDSTYDMKAVWAASHTPSAWCGGFNTSEPHRGLPTLGFEIISSAQE